MHADGWTEGPAFEVLKGQASLQAASSECCYRPFFPTFGLDTNLCCSFIHAYHGSCCKVIIMLVLVLTYKDPLHRFGACSFVKQNLFRRKRDACLACSLQRPESQPESN